MLHLASKSGRAASLPPEVRGTLGSSPLRASADSGTGFVLGADTAPARNGSAPSGAGDGPTPNETSILQAMSRRSFFVRVALVLLAATLAVSLPNFGFVVALMGAFTTMLVSFILPAVFFLLVHWRQLSWLRVGLCAGVVLLGFAGMAVGLANTLSGP